MIEEVECNFKKLISHNEFHGSGYPDVVTYETCELKIEQCRTTLAPVNNCDGKDCIFQQMLKGQERIVDFIM